MRDQVSYKEIPQRKQGEVMIIQYDTRPDATTDEKLRSLIKSIQLALGEIESSTGGGSSSQPTDISSIIASLRELSDEMAAAADAITGLDDRVTELEETVSPASYNALTNKPSIEGVTLEGNKTYDELNLIGITNSEIEALTI